MDQAEEEVDLEPNHYQADPDCKKAGKKLPEFDLYQTTVIPPNHHDLDTKPYFTKCTECPECRSKDDRERQRWFFPEKYHPKEKSQTREFSEKKSEIPEIPRIERTPSRD